MVRRYSRTEIRERLRKILDAGKPIVGAAAGTGISAVGAEQGQADLIIIYNSGRYRMAGRGSLAGLMPYGDANAIVVELAAEVLPIVKQTPVLAGVCGTDPFRIMSKFLRELKDWDFSGVQNFPTVGLIDGNFRANLEETGMSYQKDVDMIRQANELDLFTTPYVFNPQEAENMAKAGADLIVAHMGLTSKGLIGAKTTLTISEAAERTQQIIDAARKVNPKILALTHGGPVAEVEDFKYILEHVRGVQGFFGATTFERLPVEKAIPTAVRAFKALTFQA
ncbi:MAG: phosphoenolpyruvate hydrolase family protein [Candidatus Bathyarchaeia archaeon]